MASDALAALRERIKAKAESNNNNNTNSNSLRFAFWDAPENSTTTVRLLPDADPSNQFFWAVRNFFKFTFNGIKGGDPKPVTIRVPCVEMFGKEAFPSGCPVLAEVRTWYNKDEASTALANKYWKKYEYVYQGFVRESALVEKEKPENPIREFVFNKQVHNIIHAGIMDVDMKNMPTDMELGTDFRIKKTKNGTYYDYGTSTFARGESPLTAAERAAIDTFGLRNLSKSLGEVPTSNHVKAIFEMFEASVRGEQYDQDRWGQYYRPFKLNKQNSDGTQESSSVQSSKPLSQQSEREVAPPLISEVIPEVKAGNTAINDLIASIKARKNSAN